MAGNNFCNAAVRVLSRTAGRPLRCTTCNQQHQLSVGAQADSVPVNFSLVNTLERLQDRGAAGGLLAPENLVLGEVISQHGSLTSVQAGTLISHNRQVQVRFRHQLATFENAHSSVM